VSASPLAGRSLLGVFAHPDDESLACGGLLAWCADLGCEVSLLCVTRGEHGPGSGSARDLGATRVSELQAAARALGAQNVVVLGYEDGMLPFLDPEPVESDIRGAIERFSPDVVVTFDEDGLYWHPDHQWVHERTKVAVASLGGGGPALFYASIPAGRMRAVADHAARAAGPADDAPEGIFGVRDVDAFGALAPEPTVLLDAGAYAGRKLDAIRCHASQLPDNAIAFVDPSSAERLLGLEQLRRADIGAGGATFVDWLASGAADGSGSGSEEG
jgi:N-acetyl-1-D-myo-inositol-2-amino-2-deoxy-alpha-D-glucopyranoside deacetylase